MSNPQKSKQKNHPALPVVEVILATMVFATSGIWIKLADLPSTVMTFFRAGMPVILILIIYLLQKKKITPPDRWVLIGSLLNAIRLFFFYVGFNNTDISKAIIMLYTWPMFVAIINIITGREKISPKHIILLLIAFSGIELIYSNNEFSWENRDFIGMSAMLISAFFYSISVVIWKKAADKFNRTETVFYQNLVAAVVFLPFLFINILPTGNQLIFAVINGSLVGLGGFFLFFSALRKIHSAVASHLAYSEVIFAILVGVFMFGDTITVNFAMGGSLIILSIILLRINGNKMRSRLQREADTDDSGGSNI